MKAGAGARTDAATTTTTMLAHDREPWSGPAAASFSLQGGTVHRWGIAARLIRGGNSVGLGIVLGGGSWIVLVLLATFEQVVDQVLSLGVLGGHVRLLVVIPLFFVCESVLEPRVKAFVSTAVRHRLVAEAAMPRLAAEVAQMARWRESWVPDAVCLAIAVGMSLAPPSLELPGSKTAFHAGPIGDRAILTAGWYWLFCLPLFRFLALRWVFRLALWSWFLWRLARARPSLVAIHPDGVGGLGYLKVVHAEFAILIFAMSALMAATLAESFVSGAVPLSTLYSSVLILVACEALLFLGPLCIFFPQLWMCRVRDQEAWSGLSWRYVQEFEKKWLAGEPRPELLGTADVQSLSDLSATIERVEAMSLVPIGMGLLLLYAVAAMVPLLPLILFKYQWAALAQKVLESIFGL